MTLSTQRRCPLLLRIHFLRLCRRRRHLNARLFFDLRLPTSRNGSLDVLSHLATVRTEGRAVLLVRRLLVSAFVRGLLAVLDNGDCESGLLGGSASGSLARRVGKAGVGGEGGLGEL